MAMGRMNPQGHWGGQEDEADEKMPMEHESSESGHHAPHVHVHPHHENGKHVKTTVHVMHHDGQHEMHEHEPGDTEGIAAHIHQHFGGEPDEGESGTSQY